MAATMHADTPDGVLQMLAAHPANVPARLLHQTGVIVTSVEQRAHRIAPQVCGRVVAELGDQDVRLGSVRFFQEYEILQLAAGEHRAIFGGRQVEERVDQCRLTCHLG
jgi:hypothetical protein